MSLFRCRRHDLKTTFFPQEKTPAGLAVVLPGRGYRSSMPLLYYAVEALTARGFEVLTCDYQFSKDSPPDDKERILEAVRAAIGVARGKRTYPRLVVVAKSVGTRILDRLLADGVTLTGGPRVETVWLTPAWPDVVPVATAAAPALHVIGSADPLFDAATAAHLGAVVIDGADHALDVPGDVRASLAALSATVEAIDRYLGFWLAAGVTDDLGAEGGLALRLTTEADLDFVLAAEHAPDTAPFVFASSRQQHRALMADPARLHLLAYRLSDGVSVGYVILGGVGGAHRSIELGRIVAAEKGQGHGRSVVRLVKRLAFGRLGAERLWLDVKEQNTRARRLYESEGFVVEGVLRDALSGVHGRESLVLMAISAHAATARSATAD